MPTRTVPNFLIVGVQKAGTTFLAKALADHPDVYFAKPKELFFFNAKSVTKQSFDEYIFDNFFKTGGKRLIGEGSTNYFHHSNAARFIHRFLGPQTRIIVCLRHPVERLFSHYLHDYKRGRLTGAERLDGPEFAGYLARSYYASRIRVWRKRFPHFKILFFDDLVASASGFYAQAAEFLEIEPQPIEDSPVNEGLRLGWNGDILTLRAPVKMGQQVPTFNRRDVEKLLAEYAEDTRATMELTGRDLSSWLSMPDFDLIHEKFSAIPA